MLQRLDFFGECSLSGLFHLILAVNRCRRLIALSHGVSAENMSPALGHVEGSVLQLIEEQPKTIGWLADNVGIEQSWMSRSVTGMVKRKLVSARRTVSDARAKEVSLAPKGEKALADSRDVISKITSDLVKPVLSAIEARDLERFFSRLNDTLGVATSKSRTGLPALHVEFNRLARALGVFGGDVLGSGLSFLETHILHLVSLDQGSEVPFFQIERSLAHGQSTVSRALLRLLEKGLLENTQDRTDERASLWSFTAAGRQKWVDLAERGETFLHRGLGEFGAEEQSKFDLLLARLIADRPIRKSSSTNASRVILRRTADSAAGAVDFELVHDADACGKARIETGPSGKVRKVIIEGEGLNEKQLTSVVRSIFRTQRALRKQK